MTITFESEKDTIVYALEKIILFSGENQYLVVTNCVWWIAGIIRLDEGLTIHIVILEATRKIGVREISTVPRNFQRSLSAEPPNLSPDNLNSNEWGYVKDPLARTRRG